MEKTKPHSRGHPICVFSIQSKSKIYIEQNWFFYLPTTPIHFMIWMGCLP